MCGGGLGKIINSVHGLHVKADPLFGKYLDEIPQKLGMPTIGEFADSLDMNSGVSADTTTSASTQATNIASDVQSARDDEKRRRAAAAGLSSTILGGSMTGTTTGNKVLLGQ